MSTLLTAGFSLLSFAMAGLFVFAVRRSGFRLREHSPVRDRWTLIAAVIAGGVLSISAALAFSGALTDLDARPPTAALLIGATTVGTIVLAFSRFGSRLVDSWSLWALIGFQAFRIPVEMLLAGGHMAGIVPEEVTWMGWNYDVLTGITALALGLWARRRKVPKSIVWVWNVGGLVLLAIVVSTAARSAFGFLETTPRMMLPATWPGVWLPTWLVQLALFGHLLVFRRLLRARHVTPGKTVAEITARTEKKTAWNMPRVKAPDSVSASGSGYTPEAPEP